MRFLFSMAFVFLVLAIILIGKLDTSAVKDMVTAIRNRKPSLKKLSEEKKKSKLSNFASNIITALETMNQIGNLYWLILLSFLLIIVGAFAGITFGNVWLSIALGIMLAMIPFIYVRLQYIDYKSLLIDELETSLSVITSSIERTGNIVSGFEENMLFIQKPLRNIFEQFLYSVNHNIPVDRAIDTMKAKVNNKVFTDWCDTLKLVSKDRNMSGGLRPIVNRVTDIKIASSGAKNILQEANSEFISVMVLSVIFMILSYIGAPIALDALGFSLESTEFMKTLFAIDILMMFAFWFRSFLLTKDIDFEKI